MRNVLSSFLAILLFSGLSFAQTWTATVVDQGPYSDAQGNPEIRAVVVMTDGTTSIKQEFFIQSSPDMKADLVSRVQAVVSAQTNFKTKGSAITAGALSLPAAPTPDPERDAFLLALRIVRQTQSAVAFGIYKDGGPEITAALADLVSKFKPEYLNLL